MYKIRINNKDRIATIYKNGEIHHLYWDANTGWNGDKRLITIFKEVLDEFTTTIKELEETSDSTRDGA